MTQPAADGFLTIFPAGAPQPLASDLNFASGETRPNLVVVKLGTGGKVSLFTSAGTHAIFDVAGWMSRGRPQPGAAHSSTRKAPRPVSSVRAAASWTRLRETSACRSPM